MMLTSVCGFAALAWFGVLLRPTRSHRTTERLEPGPALDAAAIEPEGAAAESAGAAQFGRLLAGPDLSQVTVLIPARNEAAVIERTLSALARQGRDLRIVVVDDQSSDATAAICERFAAAAGGAGQQSSSAPCRSGFSRAYEDEDENEDEEEPRPKPLLEGTEDDPAVGGSPAFLNDAAAPKRRVSVEGSCRGVARRERAPSAHGRACSVPDKAPPRSPAAGTIQRSVTNGGEPSGAAFVPEAAVSIGLVRGAELPSGWGGKLWALQQGLAHADRPYTLLLDADIELAPGMVAALLRQARDERAALVSVMATLRCETFWERLLVPPFIFFFKLLYPFAAVNDAGRATAGAAGGCMLVETAVLRASGGFTPMRDALIDDCTLARRLKEGGARVWLGLSRSVRSHRSYPGLADFWRMITRTAYTQLRYSPALLLATTLLMLAVFVAPMAGILLGSSVWTPALGAAALAAMATAFAPVVRFYRLSAAWTLTLPVAATLFLLMTWASAIGYWRGTRAKWKNRVYEIPQ